MNQKHDPDHLDTVHHRTSEDRRSEIVDRRLARAVMGMGAALVVGASCLLVDRQAAKYLLGAAFLILIAISIYMVRTIARKRAHTRSKHR